MNRGGLPEGVDHGFHGFHGTKIFWAMCFLDRGKGLLIGGLGVRSSSPGSGSVPGRVRGQGFGVFHLGPLRHPWLKPSVGAEVVSLRGVGFSFLLLSGWPLVAPAFMKIVLAYSGGLDTSVLLSWIKEKYDAEMIAFCANIGQEDELTGLSAKARKTGASKIYIDDLQEEFAEDFIYPMIQAGAVYEGQYFLGTSIARPLIAKRMVEIAEQEGAVLCV